MTHPENIEKLYESFLNPSAGYRTAPLWVWNDEMTDDSIEFCLKEFKSHGFGGAFVHPRPGLITEYLSGDWFEKWGHALETARQLGLKLYIYDENSYPSGFAGGHVPSRLPDCFSVSAEYRIIPAKELRDPASESAAWLKGRAPIRMYAAKKQGDHLELKEDITERDPIDAVIRNEASEELWDAVMIIERQEPQLLSWLGGFANVDLLRPEVTKEFLDCTYEEYFRRFGSEFGKTIPAAFSDEPAITGSTIYNFGKKNNIPFHFRTAEAFEKQHGYDLMPHLAALFVDADAEWYRYPARKVRYDYYTTLRSLWTENFIRPMGEWCEKHHIAWTGHFMENYWPFAVGIATSPCVMANYEYMQWPAIDMLQTDLLKERPDDPLLITVLEIASAANQFGKERTLCETYGAGGFDASVEDFKRIADWLLVNGVTFINQHLSYTSIAGSRKRDHPQSFDWREPWWEEYTVLNDYAARAQVMLSAGRMEQRILVIQPTTAGFLIPPEEETGNLAYKIPITKPYMENYLALIQRLTDGQWDFDLGDEFILERNGRAEEGKLAVGQQRYEIVIISRDMANMKKSTVTLLKEYIRQGGAVLSEGQPGPYVDGLSDEAAYRELSGTEGWYCCRNLSDLEEELSARLENRVTDGARFPVGVAHRRRKLPDGSVVYYFVNSSSESFEADVRPEGELLEEWDLFTGKVKRIERKGREEALHLTLRAYESRMFVWSRKLPGSERQEENREESSGRMESGKVIPVRLAAIRPEEMNVLPIDYCDLGMNGERIREVNVIHAGRLLFRRRGFFENPWDNAIQFRNRIMDCNRYSSGSGFWLGYFFDTAQDWKAGTPIELTAERGEFFRLSCNGIPIEWKGHSQWLDKGFMKAEIGDAVRPGRNEIVLEAPIFDVRLEPEAIYLRGGFTVRTKESVFCLDAPRTLKEGSWTAQGYPFYGGAIRYEYEFLMPGGRTCARVILPEVMTTCCSVWVNGALSGILSLNCERILDISSFLTPGWNSLTIRVCGSLKNLLGPHHAADRPRNQAWPANWKEAPKYGRPEAEKYDLIDYGAQGSPIIEVY